MDDSRYATLSGFMDGRVCRANFKSFSVRKEDVIKAAMALITEHLVDQIMRENEPVD